MKIIIINYDCNLNADVSATRQCMKLKLMVSLSVLLTSTLIIVIIYFFMFIYFCVMDVGCGGGVCVSWT